MTAPTQGGPWPTRHPSARVRLEAALLDADTAAAAAPALAAPLDGSATATVLVVAAEADLRRYVCECLRERPALRVVEAATAAAAAALAAVYPPRCLVVDQRARAVLQLLAPHGAVLLVDDVPRDVPRDGPPSTARLRLLAHPFTARELVAEVEGLLA